MAKPILESTLFNNVSLNWASIASVPALHCTENIRWCSQCLHFDCWSQTLCGISTIAKFYTLMCPFLLILMLSPVGQNVSYLIIKLNQRRFQKINIIHVYFTIVCRICGDEMLTAETMVWFFCWSLRL